MLFLVLLFLAVSSVALFFLRRDRQTFCMLGLCFSFILMFVGIMIYLAKTGGLSQEQKIFLFLNTEIQRWLSYRIIPLRMLGYLIAVGRYLFPAFFLLLAVNYSMIPFLLRRKWVSWLIFIPPALSLLVYAPDIFFTVVRSRFELQLLLMQVIVVWIFCYLAAGICLLIHEYRQMTIPYCKQQFRCILCFLLGIALLYGAYFRQDPIQVYQIYSREYMRFDGRLYANTMMEVQGWYILTAATLILVVFGFWNLKNYTVVDHRESRDDLRIQRTFDTASMGVSVFVHSIKNQLLSNRVLCRKMKKELEAETPDYQKIREYAKLFEQVNESMIGRMEELYKSTKANYISLIPVKASQIVSHTLELFLRKYPEVSVETEGETEESLLADVEHLSEALYNLLTNAHEAFLASCKEEREQLALILHSERLYIGFEIRDNGAGITRQDLRKIFDPFYTSKNTNHNWGMGLYYVRNIVKSHLGMLKVDSRPGEGTSFYVMIPRYEPRGKTGTAREDKV